MDEDVHGVGQLGDARWVHQSRQDEAIFKFLLGDATFEIASQQSVADPEEAEIRVARAQVGCEVQQVVVALQVEQAGDRANGNVLCAKAKAAASKAAA